MKNENTDEEILILLVEDNKAHVELIHKAFEDQKDKANIFTAASIFEARSFLKKTNPHLVIADFVLPDGKGTDLLSGDKNPSPYPLIIMTSLGDEKIAVAAMKSVAFDYVVKSNESLRAMPSIAKRVLREWASAVKRKEAEKALVPAKEEADTREIGKENRTVLYIEDDPDQVKLIQQVISSRPHITLLSAPRAILGIELAKTRSLDLILMDINMPGINGVEAFRRFRQNEKSKEVPIVAISANALENDIKEILAEGFTDYIVKPIDIPQFLKKIDDLLE